MIKQVAFNYDLQRERSWAERREIGKAYHFTLELRWGA